MAFNIYHPTTYERASIVYDNVYMQNMRGTVDDLCEKALVNMNQHNFRVAVIWDDDETTVLAKIVKDEE